MNAGVGASSGEPSGASSWASSWAPRAELSAYAVLLAYFGARVAWLAFHLHPYVPPDEVTHIGRVLAYARVWGIPDNGPATYEYGLLDRGPWLYYWAVARTLALNAFPLPDLVFARLVNGAFGTATVVLGILWMRDWCPSRPARLLFAVLVTNTLMFTGLSASVSYDNGANLLAAASVLAFTRFRLRGTLPCLLAFGASVLAGCLSKRTFLPLAFLLVLWLLVRERRQLAALGAQAGAAFGSARAGTWSLAATVVLLAGFALALYGGNLVRYGSLIPGLDRVVGEENAMQNRVFARNRILERYRSGELTLADARLQAGEIRHKGDRSDTLFLLRAAERPESSVSGRAAYLGEWAWRILKGSVGYLGHRRAVKSDAEVYAYAAIFAAAALAIGWHWRPGASHGVPADAAFLVAGYAFVLMWFVNYPTYQTSRHIELALQGRYMFPVLVPFCGLVAWGLGALAAPKLRPWLVGAAAAWFVYGDLPWFLQRIDARWLMPPG